MHNGITLLMPYKAVLFRCAFICGEFKSNFHCQPLNLLAQYTCVTLLICFVLFIHLSDGDLGYYGTSLTAFMKQKHRMIWERRHGKIGSGRRDKQEEI